MTGIYLWLIMGVLYSKNYSRIPCFCGVDSSLPFLLMNIKVSRLYELRKVYYFKGFDASSYTGL